MPNLSLRISNDPRSVGYGYCPSSKLLVFSLGGVWGGGGVTAIIIWAIYVCAAVKGMVFKQFTLG